jgi:hypothetical protein
VIGVSDGASLAEIFEILKNNREQQYTVYLIGTVGTSPYFEILVFFEDGSLILALSGDEDQTAALAMLRQLGEFVGTKDY